MGTVSRMRTSAALCRSCEFLADEMDRLRLLLSTEVKMARWLRHQAAVEYSRIVRTDDGEYLYVHCEPAWGETPEEFERRYTRVVRTERSRVANRAGRRNIIAQRRPEPAANLFAGRKA